MVYDVNTRQLDAIPTLRTRQPWSAHEHQTGIHAVEINPSRTLLATGARNSCEVAVYRLPTLDPVCVGEAHKDWVLDMCWLDDEFLVSGSRDTKVALWRIFSDNDDDAAFGTDESKSNVTSTSTKPPNTAVPSNSGQQSLPLHDYIVPVTLKECKSGSSMMFWFI